MKALPRRLVLKGFGGALIGLPLLESQAFALPAGVQPPKRFIVFFEHGGTLSNTMRGGTRAPAGGQWNTVDGWDPAQPTEALQLGLIHQGLLDPFKSALLLPRGIDNNASLAQSPTKGGHHISNATILTSATATQVPGKELLDQGDAANFRVSNPSIDAVLAKRLKERNPVTFSSVNLELPGHHYGHPFYSPHATNPNEQVPTYLECNPLSAFDRLFDGVGSNDPAAERARKLKRSVLDGAETMLEQYRGSISANDRHAIDAHLTALRELELRLSAAVTSGLCASPAVSAPNLTKETPCQQLRNRGQVMGPLMVDIMLAALRCNLTNVVTLAISDILTPWEASPYVTNLGHSMGHDGNEVGPSGTKAASHAAWKTTFLNNRRWRMGLFARLLAGLKATPDGAGLTMLDTSIGLWTSEFANAGSHMPVDIPVLLAGGTQVLRTGRYVTFNTRASMGEYSTTASMHNLCTTLLQAFGYEDTHFGGMHAKKQGVLAGLLK